MGVNPKFMNLNCYNAIILVDQLSHDILAARLDVVSLNEPYVSEGSARGVLGSSAIVN